MRTYTFLIFTIFSIKLFLIHFANAQNFATNNTLTFNKLYYSNIQDLLIKNHGWNKNLIGPFGQAYRMEIDPNTMNSYIDLHPIMKKKYDVAKKTFVCELFKNGRNLILSNDNLIQSNYSEKDAVSARRKYLLTGQKLTDQEWKLADQYTWLTFISEGTGSINFKQKIFNKPLKIQKCSPHSIKVNYSGKLIKFPNLILSIPNYVYLETGSKFKKNVSYKENKLSKLINESTNSLLVAINYLVDTKQWDLYDHKSFTKKLISNNIKPRNYILMGKICKYNSIDKCAKMLNHIYVAEDPNILLDYAYERLKSEFKYN